MIKINERKIEGSKQKKDLDNLKTSQEAQNNDITDLMLATAEICEMVLSSQQTSVMSLKNINEGGSSMAAIYVGLIERSLKTIDQVPIKYREEVRKMCETLEIPLS
ncbi:hypothetical protein GSQ51_18290 [Clostridioides difficile]|nr:hypothetical protein [Clostridioides difficile]NJK16039.1 hypothetical protein [Clostridioides difficile]